MLLLMVFHAKLLGNMNKIFLIGSNKTGITSLSTALNNLKYRIIPINIFFRKNSILLNDFLDGYYDKIFNLVDKFDVFYDRPWNHNDFYKLLNEKYINSNFILTIRNPENWYKSYQRFAKAINLREKWFYNKVSNSLYGIDDFLSNKNIMIEKFNERNKQIIKYFENKNNFLIMNIENGDGYEKLCNFLNKSILNQNFPHERKTVHGKLHICTPLFRYEYLEKVYNSIPDCEDIIWHISFSSKNKEPNINHNKKNLIIKTYPVDCEDKDTVKKRNEIFKNIKDGYFCLLDDDTEFHIEMYNQYKKCLQNNYVGIFVGMQIFKNNKIRLMPSIPQNCMIDSGNVLAHSSCLEKCSWPLQKKTYENRDCIFWKSVFDFFHKKSIMFSKPISYYNSLKN